MRQTLASLAALPDRQREALIRTAVSGDSQEEVARDLGLTDNALRQLVHRARMSMRAAATALTPMPLVTAAASGSSRGGSLVERIAELVAGGGASVTLAKAGTVAVLAGSAISGPAIVDTCVTPPCRRPPGRCRRPRPAPPAWPARARRRAKPVRGGAGRARIDPCDGRRAPARSVTRDHGTDRPQATRRAEDHTRLALGRRRLRVRLTRALRLGRR